MFNTNNIDTQWCHNKSTCKRHNKVKGNSFEGILTNELKKGEFLMHHHPVHMNFLFRIRGSDIPVALG